MSLKYAICGFLNYGPLSGYDLNRLFNRSASYFWPATQSQIYRTLEELAREGWAEVSVKKQEGRPDRKLYYLTDLGREQLNKWIKTYHPLRRERMPIIVQFFFAGQSKNQKVIDLLEKRAAQHRERLAFYRGETRTFLERAIAQTGRERDGKFWQLSLNLGIGLEKAWLEWIEDTIEELKRLQDGDEAASPRKRNKSLKSSVKKREKGLGASGFQRW